jgi:ketosteroid isomerase-like protein
MSQENVEVVRRLYETGDFDTNPPRWLDHAAPDLEFVNPPDAVEAGIRRGRNEVLTALSNVGRGFESARHELIECHSGGSHVVAWVRFRARARGSTAELEQYEAHTWTFREGEIVRFKWGRDWAEALEAVGLSE